MDYDRTWKCTDRTQADDWIGKSRRIIGCAMEVLNTLGHGLLEKPYEEALVVEFRLNRIPHVRQPRYGVQYKGNKIGTFVPDLVVYDSIVVDTKVVERIGDLECGQMLNYLKITQLNSGLLLNFSRPRLEWRRVVV